ncbi:MAG: hypothetical protein FWB86_00815 [Treponema sp.]|nr:hypothetical protein [Treponema sp.]MCL2250637.1 hypothetical protein [Treponema sp.]
MNLPVILRARDYRLYTKNQRLVDLWLNGGAAIMGHTPSNLLREIKNTASRGLYAPFPHFTEGRLLKALSKLLPAHNFRIYAAPPQELITLFEDGKAKLWRPFKNPEAPFAADENAPLLILVLPGISLWCGGLPMGLCVTAQQMHKQSLQLPEGETLSPVLLAAAARGVYDILAAPQRAKPLLPRIDKICTQQTENKVCIWKREGIYLTLKEEIKTEEWETLFCQFLEAGFLLPPTQSHPLILPGEMSAGEEAKLAGLLCSL